MEQRIGIDEIELDCQIRVKGSNDYIEDLVEVIDEKGWIFPPARGARLNDGKVHLSDGYHRAIAAMRAALTYIPVELFNAMDYADVLADAVRCAQKNTALRFTREDWKNARILMYRAFPNLSHAEMARRCGCSDKTVAAERQRLEEADRNIHAGSETEEVQNLTSDSSDVESQTIKRIGKDGKARRPRRMPTEEYDASEHYDAKEESRYDSDNYDAKGCSPWDPDAETCEDSDLIETADAERGFVDDEPEPVDDVPEPSDKPEDKPCSINVETSRKILELFGQLDRDFIIATLTRLNDKYGYLLS